MRAHLLVTAASFILHSHTRLVHRIGIRGSRCGTYNHCLSRSAKNLGISAPTKEKRCPIEISFCHQKPPKLGCAKRRTLEKTDGTSSKHIPRDRFHVVT